MADDLRRLVIEIGASYVGAKGLSRMDHDFDKILGKQKSLAAAARAQADAQIKEATRSSAALQKINDRIALSNRRMEDMMVRQAWAASRGRIQAYQSVTAAIGRENEKIIAMQKTLEREQIASEQRIAAATVQANRARNVARVGAVAGGVGALGSGLIGAGAVGLGAGILAGRSAMNWQTMVSQNVANSPMTPAERRAFQQLAFRTATRTGARPEDVFYALRLGSEMQLGPQQDRRYLQSALALGLPTGGSAAVAPSLQAIASVGHNFPQYKNNPQAIAKMLLATVQQSAGGVNVQELTSNMPAVLAMAGHIGGKSSLADALGAAAALGQTGLGMPEISTQLINFLKTLQSGTARPNSLTSKTLEALRTQRGINLFPDFSQQGLAQKGLGGVLSDIAGANLSQKTLFTLFPNMRGTLAALGLTGNQYRNFMNVQPYIQNAPQRNDLAKNMANYMGLSGTKLKEFNEQLHILAITTGTQLLPEFNKLMKDAIIPGAKEVAHLTHEYRGQIVELIKLSPWIIAGGVGLKTLSGGLKLIGGTLALIDAVKAEGVLRGVAGALGLVSKESAVATDLQTLAAAEKTVGTNAALATGETAAAGAGTGLLGVAGGLARVAAPIAGLVAGLYALGKAEEAAFGKGSLYRDKNGNLNLYDNPLTRALANRNPQYPGKQDVLNPGYRYGTVTMPVNPGTYTSTAPSGVAVGSNFGGFPAQSITYGPTDMLRAGIMTSPGAWEPAAMHVDLGTPLGTRFSLPGGKDTPYTLVRTVDFSKNSNPNIARLGLTEIWRTPGGGLTSVSHLSNAYYKKPGTRVTGATIVGETGVGEGQQHLHIAMDPAAVAWMERRGILPGFHPTAGPSVKGSLRKGFESGVTPWAPWILREAKRQGVDPDVIAAIVQTESHGSATAYNPQSHAHGLMQLIPSTGKAYGLKHVYSGPENIAAGTKYFAYLLNGPAHGNYDLAIRMYYAGPNGALYTKDVNRYAAAVEGLSGPLPSPGSGTGGTGGTGGTTPGGGVNVNLGQGAALTPVQKWTTRVQGDITQYNARMTAFGWPAGTPIGRVQKPAHRQLVAGYYNDAVWAYAHQLIAQIQAGPGPEADKAAATHAVWIAYRNGTLEQQLFGKVPPGATRPTTPGGWATWYGNRASTLQTRIGAIAADFPGADLTHPNARQRRLLSGLLTGPHGLYRTTLEQTLSMDKVIYAGQPKLRELADRAAWGAYHRAMRHPFAYFPATGANQRPTTPAGWSQWYGARASDIQGELALVASSFPGADLTHPNARQRAILLPLLLGRAGHPGYYKDLLREKLSIDRVLYAGQPHRRAMADRAAWGAYHRELRHPFAYFQGTSATGSQITPVQVVGSNKQLGVAEEHLKVAKQQLAEQKKQTHQEQQQIRHLERVINKLVHWINHHGGHVNVANDYSGVAVTGTAGHP